MILLWSERKLLARIVFYLNFLLSLQYSESCELSLRFLCSGHCPLSGLEQFIIKLLLIQQSNLNCACAVGYSTDSPSSFSVYSFVRICGFGLKGSGLGLDKINYASIIFGIIGRLLGTSIIENNRALN